MTTLTTIYNRLPDPKTSAMLYLSKEAAEAIDIRPSVIVQELAAAIAKIGDLSTSSGKLSLSAANGHYFQALPCIYEARGIAALKWVAVVDPTDSPDAHITASLMLTDIRIGTPLALMRAEKLTAVRTAAMSAIAAKALAEPGAKTLGFIGCGLQARCHLDSLMATLPAIREVLAYSRSQRSADLICEEATKLGLTGKRAADAREVLEGSDVVVSSVPAFGLSDPFLDARWLKENAFVSAVDLGRSWVRESLNVISTLATDERGQSSYLAKAGKLAHPGPYHFDLAELSRSPAAAMLSGRRMMLFGGLAICDAIVGAIYYEHAKAHDIGLALA